jgi:hypothetical protein
VAPPVRPVPVKNESQASGPLHNLQGELLTAKAAWEHLGVRISKGYTTAYGFHAETVQKLNNIAEARWKAAQASVDGLTFVFSVVCVGFSGGVAGALLGPWVKRAGEKTARFVFREGARGIIQQGAKEIAKRGSEKVEKLIENEWEEPYKVTAPKDIAVDEDIRDRIDTAFGPLLESLDAMIAEANRTQANLGIGQEILNSFRQSCPLMTDKPAEDDIPTEKAVADLTEVAIWIAWANELRLSDWDPVYRLLDESARQEAKINRDGGGTGETYPNEVQMVEDMGPLNQRMRAFPATWVQVKRHTAKFVSPEPWKATPVDYTDLRKLSALGIDSMLPFKRLAGLNLQWNRTQPLERVKFLSKFQSLKPVYKP